MGKLLSIFKVKLIFKRKGYRSLILHLLCVPGHDNDGNNSYSSLSASDESTDDESSDRSDIKPLRRKKRAKKKEATDGWEEICGIATDVLEDVMTAQKHKVRQTGRYKLEKNLKFPTVDENREKLRNAYNLWLKFCPQDSEVYMPNWEGILERPVVEQSFLVDEYVRKVYYLLELEDIPDYNIPENIPKDEILIRNPNKPGTYTKLSDALKQKERHQKIKQIDLEKDNFFNKPSTSHYKIGDSVMNLNLPKRTHPHYPV